MTIENPILNSPFREPGRHFKFDDQGITNEIVDGRRPSTYFVPVPKSRSKGSQTQADWYEDRAEPNPFVDELRGIVARWREAKYPNVTFTTRKLLEHWTNPERENKLFFCQIEALETIIYLAEVAEKSGNARLLAQLREKNREANPELFRLAMKMATGSGKTVVMAMLIAWQALNKSLNKQDARFTDAFLIVAPGITIKDRLRVLLPNDSDNYYHKRDLLPPELAMPMGEVSFVITNFHAFQKRTLTDISKTGRAVLFGRRKPVEEGIFTESDAQMVRRVLKDLGNKKNILVINDEAHHCYRRRAASDEDEEKLKGEERKEAEERDEEARIWISGLEAIQKQRGIKCVYDLSATPFFLKGSGYNEGTPFQWIVSDFSLIDAIESGVVKIPRVPVEDNKMAADGPTYRDLWLNIRDKLPKKGRKKQALDKHAPPALPAELETALESLYSNYRKYYKQWEKASASNPDATPPVFIVVCNNTNVSSEVYRYIAGYERLLPDGSMVHVKGKLDLFSNVDPNGKEWLKRPNTILVDSQQLESGDAMSQDFKQAASYEIEEFKNEYRKRFPDRDVEKLTDEDLLREVMNTVGKAGKIGAGIRCVVSVSMLTEGWDANTVTHILGVRAFGTQLLCEQVVGRGLRRMSYAANEEGMFVPEYAEIYGVPFSFIPTAGSGEPPDPKRTTRVRALKEREHLRITFPRVIGYKYEFPDKKLRAKFVKESRMTLSTRDFATRTDVEGIIGPGERHTIEHLKSKRVQEVAFHVAKTALERYFTGRQDIDNRVAPGAPMLQSSPVATSAEFVEASLFPQVLRITKDWMDTQLICEGEAFPQLLMVSELMRDAASHIHLSIPPPEVNGEPRILPRMADYDAIGSSDYVDFDTAKPTYETRKSHVSHVIADTISWEQKMAQNLEEDPRVIAYVKNDHLGFTIPYDFQGEERQYYPDFIALVREADGSVINLIVEVSSYPEPEKSFKVATARDKWVPAINNDGRSGRWMFVEVTDPWSYPEIVY